MVWQHFAHCTCFVLYLTLLKYSTLHIFHALLGILYFALLTLQNIAYSMLCFVFCSAYIAGICTFPMHCFVFLTAQLQHIAYSTLCSLFCTAHIVIHCIFHALLCILHCSYCSTLHIPCFALYFKLLTCIIHALFLMLHCSHCSTLHIPCLVLYFALLTFQQITNSMLYSVFCTAHTAAHCSKLIVNKRQCTQHIAHHKVYTFPLHNTFQNA